MLAWEGGNGGRECADLIGAEILGVETLRAGRARLGGLAVLLALLMRLFLRDPSTWAAWSALFFGYGL